MYLTMARYQMKVGKLKLFECGLFYRGLRLAVFSSSKRQAARLLARTANDVDLCSWHDYSISEVYEITGPAQNLDGLCLLSRAEDVVNGIERVDERRVDFLRRDIARLRKDM